MFPPTEGTFLAYIISCLHHFLPLPASGGFRHSLACDQGISVIMFKVHSPVCVKSPPASLHMALFHSFLWLRNIPLWIYTTSSLSMHPSMDI